MDSETLIKIFLACLVAMFALCIGIKNWVEKNHPVSLSAMLLVISAYLSLTLFGALILILILAAASGLI